jgi:alkylation response protein AidB-like acyl-CoA dehydrogenase
LRLNLSDLIPHATADGVFSIDNGYAKEFPHEQRLRDCIGMESADGPREIHHGIIARDLVGRDFAPF